MGLARSVGKIEYNIPRWHQLVIGVIALVTLGCFAGMVYDRDDIQYWSNVLIASLGALAASFGLPLVPKIARAATKPKKEPTPITEPFKPAADVEKLRKYLGDKGTSILLDRMTNTVESRSQT